MRSSLPKINTADKPKQIAQSKTKGYWSNGVWVKAAAAAAEHADLPLSRTEEKEVSHALQQLGLDLSQLRSASLEKLQAHGHVSERLAQELGTYRKLTAHEAKRRQSQLLGKLMRGLPDEAVAAIELALREQRLGSAADAAAIHRAELWRDLLIANDDAMPRLLEELTATPAAAPPDTQHLRALVRQARKDLAAPVAEGAVRQARAYRELFQAIKALVLQQSDAAGTAEAA